ncbi:hypothetical protein TMKG_04035, partial [Mycobacterium tuberculosis SUMu011]
MAARSAADLHHRRVVDARKPCRAARLRQPVEPVFGPAATRRRRRFRGCRRWRRCRRC